MVIAYSIEVTPKDFKRILKKPKRSGIWLSQKMAEKSKEVSWQRLIQEEKVEFDEAQAVELNNVLTSAAVRALSQSEHKGLDYNKVMRMRWVLTRKNSGAAKARLPHYCSDGGAYLEQDWALHSPDRCCEQGLQDRVRGCHFGVSANAVELRG